MISEFERTSQPSRTIAAGFDLDDVRTHPVLGEVNLRFIYLLAIEDFARHAGHGDILREQIEHPAANELAAEHLRRVRPRSDRIADQLVAAGGRCADISDAALWDPLASKGEAPAGVHGVVSETNRRVASGRPVICPCVGVLGELRFWVCPLGRYSVARGSRSIALGWAVDNQRLSSGVVAGGDLSWGDGGGSGDTGTGKSSVLRASVEEYPTTVVAPPVEVAAGERGLQSAILDALAAALAMAQPGQKRWSELAKRLRHASREAAWRWVRGSPRRRSRECWNLRKPSWGRTLGRGCRVLENFREQRR